MSEIIQERTVTSLQGFQPFREMFSDENPEVSTCFARWEIICNEAISICLKSIICPEMFVTARLDGRNITELVGGLEHGFYDFPYIGNFTPNWRSHIFSEG